MVTIGPFGALTTLKSAANYLPYTSKVDLGTFGTAMLKLAVTDYLGWWGTGGLLRAPHICGGERG